MFLRYVRYHFNIYLVIKAVVWVLRYSFMYQGIYLGVKVSRFLALGFWV